jgi:hypothetical protein
LEKVTAMELERLSRSPFITRLVKCHRVAPEEVGVYADLLFAPGHDRPVTERPSQEAERLAKGSARVSRV